MTWSIPITDTKELWCVEVIEKAEEQNNDLITNTECAWFLVSSGTMIDGFFPTQRFTEHLLGSAPAPGVSDGNRHASVSQLAGPEGNEVRAWRSRPHQARFPGDFCDFTKSQPGHGGGEGMTKCVQKKDFLIFAKATKNLLLHIISFSKN